MFQRVIQELLQEIPQGLKVILVTYSAVIFVILACAFFIQKSQYSVISRYDYNVATNTRGPNYPFSAAETFFDKLSFAPSIHYADGQWVGRWPPYAQMGYMVVIMFFLLLSLPAVVVIKYPKLKFFVLSALLAFVLGWVATIAWNGNWFGFDSDTSGLAPLFYSVVGGFVFVVESVFLYSYIKTHSNLQAEQSPQLSTSDINAQGEAGGVNANIESKTISSNDVSAANYFRLLLKWLVGILIILALLYIIYVVILLGK